MFFQRLISLPLADQLPFRPEKTSLVQLDLLLRLKGFTSIAFRVVQWVWALDM